MATVDELLAMFDNHLARMHRLRELSAPDHLIDVEGAMARTQWRNVLEIEPRRVLPAQTAEELAVPSTTIDQCVQALRDVAVFRSRRPPPESNPGWIAKALMQARRLWALDAPEAFRWPSDVVKLAIEIGATDAVTDLLQRVEEDLARAQALIDAKAHRSKIETEEAVARTRWRDVLRKQPDVRAPRIALAPYPKDGAAGRVARVVRPGDARLHRAPQGAHPAARRPVAARSKRAEPGAVVLVPRSAARTGARRSATASRPCGTSKC